MSRYNSTAKASDTTTNDGRWVEDAARGQSSVSKDCCRKLCLGIVCCNRGHRYWRPVKEPHLYAGAAEVPADAHRVERNGPEDPENPCASISSTRN